MGRVSIFKIKEIIKWMDLEDFLKLEHESPIKTSHDQFNPYLTHFYDQDSDCHAVKQENCPSTMVDPEQLINRIIDQVDLRAMSLESAVEYAKLSLAEGETVDWKQFNRKLKKRKLALKRASAKQRVSHEVKKQYYIICDHVEAVDIKEEIQAEIKKKRNRMSAQVSRDRRKLKIQDLELNNRKLQAETEKMMHENQKLKRQLDEFNRAENKKTETGIAKNKFLSFIIMLGMFLLLTVLKQAEKLNYLSDSTRKFLSSDSDVLGSEEQSAWLEQGERTIKYMESQPGPQLMHPHLVTSLLSKLQQLRAGAQDLTMSAALKAELESIRRQVI